MADLQLRLVQCFLAVFPESSKEEVPRLSVTSNEHWDSLASVNLFGVIEEEFGIEINPGDLEHLVSFGSFLDYLKADKGIV